MKITDGFDGRHGKFYFISLVAMAFASALMLVAALRGAEPLQVPQEVGVSVAAFSLMCSTASYLLIGKLSARSCCLGLRLPCFRPLYGRSARLCRSCFFWGFQLCSCL
ncbi:hypothetical protein U0039_22580 [Stenotrophomonas maltophilia]|uniref:hypothetical protein n=1 Tax=Stenotrophomonas maltophilia TaxID=40324 RepID=UPI00117E2296|nr:hypothetical protein [Stenotrophomonas maltophilia]QQA82465.1 hypothetical protein I6I01_21190 [Stenotrophomonas maltophilia]WQE23652.1 hypothetical protein U0039_22580 [Stenotrophomonas maltophilia]HDS1016135.1 hypothetical protein [Stenotrophomonas maltophilia]